MTDYTEPTEDQFQPLLKRARQIHVRTNEPNPPRAVAVFDPETGDLIAGPRRVESGSRVEWSVDGIFAKGAGAFTSYDDLRLSWRVNARQREEHEQYKAERERERDREDDQ